MGRIQGFGGEILTHLLLAASGIYPMGLGRLGFWSEALLDVGGWVLGVGWCGGVLRLMLEV